MEKINAYYEMVKPFILRHPDNYDNDTLELGGEQLLIQEIQRLAQIPRTNFDRYFAKKENPMPVFLGGPYDYTDDSNK